MSNANKSILRGSARIREGEKRRIIDETTRKRRQRRILENLEADNYHEDPHADLVMSKKIPKFDDNLETRTRSRKKEKSAEYYQTKFRKYNFMQLLEEDRAEAETTGRYCYTDIAAKDTKLPHRHFCAVCGFFSHYVCLTCGVRYCGIKCMQTHMDTRCLKWAG